MSKKDFYYYENSPIIIDEKIPDNEIHFYDLKQKKLKILNIKTNKEVNYTLEIGYKVSLEGDE